MRSVLVQSFLKCSLQTVLVFLLLGVATGAVAQEPAVVIDAGSSYTRIVPVVSVLEDPTGKLEFEQVRSSTAFKPAPQIGTNFGFSQSAWWVRFSLSNPGDDDRHFVLREDYPLIDHLEFWASAHDGQWHEIATGDRTAFSTREFVHRDFLFDLEVPAGEQRTFYLRAASAGPVDLNLAIYGPHALVASVSGEQLAYGAYYGGFIVLVLYN
ncbi:7TM-DISM domain-containing protein, partial [Dokdonella sp.]|uniref:7TMR-DISMED2 domain-containing protein n=1 Tax=Dokdonella sp. TaxID=2291710 RepID=UPI002DD6A6DA